MIAHTLTIHDADGRVVNTFTFESGEAVVGRGADADIRLQSSTVSRKHARFRVEGAQCSVEDLGSANGVFLGEQRLSRPVLLPPNANIVVGDFAIRYSAREAAPRPSPPTGPAPAAAKGPPPLPAASSADRWFLIRVGDHLEGEYFELSDPEMMLGRTDQNQLQVLDPSVSRLHARFQLQGPHYVVVDNGSANGTRVNGERIAQPVVLREGDAIAFGDICFVLTSHPERFRFDGTAADGATRISRPPATARGTAGPDGPNVLILVAGIAALVLVASAIGLLLIARSPAPAAPETASAATSAGADFNRGLRAFEQQDWMGAVAALESAQLRQPSGETDALLERARNELDASETLRRCAAQIEAAINLEGSGQALAAVETYEDARRCHESIRTGTSAHRLATERIRDQIDPALAALYRQLGALALRSGDTASAVQSLDRAAEILRGAGHPLPDNLEVNLRVALLGAADRAFTDEAWRRAADLYGRAAELGALEPEHERRFTRAQRMAR